MSAVLAHKVDAWLVEHDWQTWTTRELVEAIEPEATKRQEVYKALMRLAPTTLSPYATRGEPQPGRGPMAGKMVRPWVWHASDGSEPKGKPPTTAERLDAIEADVAAIKAFLVI